MTARFQLLFTILSFLLMNTAHAAGLIKPKDTGLPDLEIREHHVNVVIEDGYATTSIEQVFYNPNPIDLEAIYSFPVPEGAAVGEFIYWIDEQAVIGEVMEKKQARTIYEEQKAAGRQAALVEQDAYRSFDIAVYPVRAQSTVKIKLVYLQAAHVDTNVGRYVYPLEDGGVDEVKNAFWSRNETVKEKFSFNLHFRSSYPVDAIRLPKHQHAQISQVGEDEWTVALINKAHSEEASADAEIITLTEDIVVYWRHQEGLPGSLDMVTYKPGAEAKGTFMMTLTPGEDLGVINHGSDWLFVLDISGSMQGKYAALAEGVRQGLAKLRHQDRFKVVLFNDSARNLTNGFMFATPENVQTALTALESYQVNGGTNLYAGLKMGLAAADADRPLGLILVTDGVANVGITEKKQFLKLLEKHDLRLFTFIMGNSANRPLLKEMADISNGFAMSVSNSDDIVGKIMQASSKLNHYAYTDVEITIDGVRIKNLSPENISSIYRGQQLTVFGHYWGHGTADVRLKAKAGAEEKVYETRIEFPEQDTRNPELERLWAFATIEKLQAQLDYLGEDKDMKQAITDIALEYSLVTDYTSMIVLENAVFDALNLERKNKQRVETENQAREQRKSQPIKSNRADNAQPMFSQPRSSGQGGGALHPAIILALFSFYMLINIYQRKAKIYTN